MYIWTYIHTYYSEHESVLFEAIKTFSCTKQCYFVCVVLCERTLICVCMDVKKWVYLCIDTYIHTYMRVYNWNLVQARKHARTHTHTHTHTYFSYMPWIIHLYASWLCNTSAPRNQSSICAMTHPFICTAAHAFIYLIHSFICAVTPYHKRA